MVVAVADKVMGTVDFEHPEEQELQVVAGLQRLCLARTWRSE